MAKLKEFAPYDHNDSDDDFDDEGDEELRSLYDTKFELEAELDYADEEDREYLESELEDVHARILELKPDAILEQGVAEGGAETSWSNDTDTITLQDILELTKHIKQINLPIDDNLKSKLLHWEGNPEEIERVNQVTVSNQFPILIMVDEQGQIAWILDGNHRLHKAIQSQARTIPAKLIRPSNLDDKAKKIFNVKEQGVAEGSEDKIKQLKADHATAVHWSKNEKSPQKREAARQKAEKIKAHLEKQYKQGVAEGLGKQIHGTFQSMGDSFGDAHLAKGISYFLQGRHQEGENMLRSKIPEKAQNIVFSKLKTLQAQSGLDVNKNPNIQKYIDDELVPWVKRQIQQGVAERMKMGATNEPIEEDKEVDPVVNATIKFYTPVMQKAQEQEVDHYVEKARHLLQKTDDPMVRKKLIDIFKEGKHNPYLQGGIITAIAALLGGGAINLANNIQLTPYQTNLMMQGILNTIVPAVSARLNGRNWKDTLKFTLASLGVGVGIASVMEKEDDVMSHVAKDLTGTGAPIAKLRAARDKEQMKKRERSDGLPVEPKFDYLDEK